MTDRQTFLQSDWAVVMTEFRAYEEKIAFSILLIPARALTCHQGNLWLILRAVNEGVNEWLTIQIQTLYNQTFHGWKNIFIAFITSFNRRNPGF